MTGMLLKTCSILLLIITMPLMAQEEGNEGEQKKKTTWDEIKEGILSSFSFSYQDLRRKELQEGFTVGGGVTIPLRRTMPTNEYGFETQGQVANNYALFGSVTYVPVTYWFWNVTAYRYLDNKYVAPWNPEFSYRFGYDDWHPYTFSLVYGNYGGNRLFPDREKGEVWTHFNQGTITLGWKFPEPDAIAKIFLIDSSAEIRHSINYNVTPRYTDFSGQGLQKWKQSLSFGTNYTIYEWWYLNFSLFYYPIAGQQQPWDPDFTYGFGYFDWHSGSVTVQYNNYSGNRFFWRKNSQKPGGFFDGSILISSSWTF
ncbi:MAG TPA: hypothetical protein VEC36_13650 [Patescibacteria group bacterium]|nr:hypothetical protein [Patescibacteria group bacterium]